MNELREQRRSLRMSQERLARRAGIFRYRLALAELGDVELTPVEVERLESALRREARRLREVTLEIERTASPEAIARS